MARLLFNFNKSVRKVRKGSTTDPFETPTQLQNLNLRFSDSC